MASGIEELRESARSRGTGCHWRSVGHDYAYRRYRAWGTVLAVLTGAASAVAGSALLSSAGAGSAWAIVAGIIGLLGAILAAAERGLSLAQRAEDNRQAGGAFRVVRNKYWDFDKHPPPRVTAARQRFDEINAERDEWEMKAAPLEQWADDKATAGYEQAMRALKRRRKAEASN